MDVALDTELAMVLPLPVPPRPADDAVAFVNLEGYERFFGDLAVAFPPMFQAAAKGFARAPVPQARPTLVVHDVGSFEASFVPTLADFVRLDERFRMPDGIWEGLPAYADWGFAVFQLKPKKGLFGLGGAKKQSIQPMAFSFPTRGAEESLYFPLLHIHDGHVASHAQFDHALYCQADGVLASTLGWTRSTGPLGTTVDAARARGLIDGGEGGFVHPLVGELRNQDLWLEKPPGVTLADLAGRGECHAYEVSAAYANIFAIEGTQFELWKKTASTRLAALCQGMRDGLRELTAQRRASWNLAPLSDDLPAHFINGNQLWTGTSYMDGTRATPSGPGRVTFSPFSDNVSMQSVTLGFSELPDHERVQEIIAELKRLLDRAVS
jgi:hypothetical protein